MKDIAKTLHLIWHGMGAGANRIAPSHNIILQPVELTRNTQGLICGYDVVCKIQYFCILDTM